MSQAQKGILAPVPKQARYLSFTIAPEENPAGSLRNLCKLADGDKTVVGLGQSLVRALGREVRGLEVFSSYTGAGFDVPSTPAVLWCWLRGDDRGELVHRARAIVKSVAPVLQMQHTIGRRKRDNKELGNAPASAHVKRMAQESFNPAAFILRRSMPWADAQQAGLVFVAFGNSFDAFDALLRRMVGAEDGIVDAWFTFTRPISGSYFWCSPMKSGRLDLCALGL
jgi:deferrochelatase/peroxidase EfeB